MQAQSRATREAVMARRTHQTALPGWRVKASEREARPDNAGVENCSLVIATYDRQAELMRLLRALQSIADPPAEVVIEDGIRPRNSAGSSAGGPNPKPFRSTVCTWKARRG